MRYKHRLPQMKHFVWLAKLVGDYPVSNHEMLRTAERWGFKHEVVWFLKLFDPGETYYSRADFLTRCSELMALIKQEWEQPIEFLRSPQG